MEVLAVGAEHLTATAGPEHRARREVAVVEAFHAQLAAAVGPAVRAPPNRLVVEAQGLGTPRITTAIQSWNRQGQVLRELRLEAPLLRLVAVAGRAEACSWPVAIAVAVVVVVVAAVHTRPAAVELE